MFFRQGIDFNGAMIPDMFAEQVYLGVLRGVGVKPPVCRYRRWCLDLKANLEFGDFQCNVPKNVREEPSYRTEAIPACTSRSAGQDNYRSLDALSTRSATVGQQRRDRGYYG
jgi:hypothetical protein